eukprot:831313_1
MASRIFIVVIFIIKFNSTSICHLSIHLSAIYLSNLPSLFGTTLKSLRSLHMNLLMKKRDKLHKALVDDDLERSDGVLSQSNAKQHEITMTEDEMTSLLATYTFANSQVMVQFQQKLHNKIVHFICNVLRLIWSDEIIFFTIPLVMWIVQGKIGLTILFVCTSSEIVNGYLKWMIQKPRP